MADVEQVAPGATFHIVVLLDVAAQWHVYWKNPGAGAARIGVEVKSTPSAQVGDIQWPRPDVLASPTGDMYVYEGRVGLFVPVVAPEVSNERSLQCQVEIDWAVCDEERCQLASAGRTVTVPMGALTKPSKDPAIDKARARLIRPMDQVEGASMRVVNGQLELELPAQGYTTATFLPNGAAGVVYGEPRFRFAGPTVHMRLPVEIDRNNVLDQEPVVGGVIALGPFGSGRSYEFHMRGGNLARQDGGSSNGETSTSSK